MQCKECTPVGFEIPPTGGLRQRCAAMGGCLGLALHLVVVDAAQPEISPIRTASSGLEEPASVRGTQKVPTPLPDHPGNVFLEGEDVIIIPPQNLAPSATEWRLMSDRPLVQRHALQSSGGGALREPIRLGQLPVGWYRLAFGPSNQADLAWTTLAVLGRLRVPVPPDSPIAVDSAASWFARDDQAQQKRLASLAALAGVSWVRDRLRWADIQPAPGPLKGGSTTYDTSAKAHHEAGLQVLQVFHDTPPWARASGAAGGRFAPDLRRVYELCHELATRFKGQVAAWEPWNEANVATFGGHTVDQMCSWQKAAWLGFKAGDPDVVVGWNATAAVPTPAHTDGVLANETWPYFDTYNIHTYDWSDGYLELWRPAREAAAGRPLWITEADRGTPHLKNPPWYDQDSRLERLKAEWIAQAYASSLFAGASRHFHFILGNYQEPNGVQFGLLRYDLTPRPAYVSLAAVGRCLAGARVIGRWQPGDNVHIYAFRASPNGEEHDVLVAWAEKQADWDARGTTTTKWPLPAQLKVQQIVDYLGRSQGTTFPSTLTSAPVFVLLPAGEAESLPLERPPAQLPWREGKPSPIVLQSSLPDDLVQRVEDLPWSEGYTYRVTAGQAVDFSLHVYNFATNPALGRILVAGKPRNWEVTLPAADFKVEPQGRGELAGTLRLPSGDEVQDGWVVLRAECGELGLPALAFRLQVRQESEQHHSTGPSTSPSPWKPHTVLLQNGGKRAISLPASFQIVTENWNRVVAVPYLVALPEQKRLLMLLSCDYPHRPMLTHSEDGGTTWSRPAFFRSGDPGGGGSGHVVGTSLTYLGSGALMLCAGDGERWRSSDYGETWQGPFPLEKGPGGSKWYEWDPYLVDRDPQSQRVLRIAETGYTATMDTPSGGHAQAFIRFSQDEGRTWSEAIKVPQWQSFNEVALVRARNGDMIAGCRSEVPEKYRQEIDHYEGLGTSCSTDNGHTWSRVNMLYAWGRHHPSMVVMPTGEVVMTYVVRKGYTDTPDGYPRFGVEAVVSRDNGRAWDLDHRYILAVWTGNRKGPNQWWASSQATSTLLLPDDSLLTAFGTGYRSQPDAKNLPAPRDVGLVRWRLSGKLLNAERTIRDVPFDSDVRNVFDLPPMAPLP